jgi:uncharacterized protein YbjT (DUF2867 family)
MILVTGASGSVGGAVVHALRHSAAPFRAMFRAEKDAAKAPPGVTTVLGDFADKQSLKAALAGIDVVFIVCGPVPALVELEGAMIDASREAGVRHILLNSALGAADYPKSFPSWHRKVEEKLKSSGVPFTILRPNGFMQNILAYMAPSIRAQNAFYAAMGAAKTSFLDVRDIGAVAAKILANPAAHAGKIYELNGPEAVTYADLASRISKVAGRQINFIDIPESAQQKSMLDMGMPAWQVQALLELQQYYTGGEGGEGGEVSGVLESLLGKPPVRLDDFLQEFKDAFRPA